MDDAFPIAKLATLTFMIEMIPSGVALRAAGGG